MGKSESNELSTITSSELSSVIYSPLVETIKNPFSRKIFLMWVRVAGIGYRENIDELLKNLKVGDNVLLVREPENEYDNLAIMIQNEDKAKLGYVPRANNDIPARMMDAGFKLCGKVYKIKDQENGEYPWDALSVEIFLDESSNELFGIGKSRPFSRQIFLADIPTADTYKIDNIKRVLSKMKVGDKVLLRREPDNEQDDMAIVVLNKHDRKLGYIPRSHSIILARLLEAGKHIYGTVSGIYYKKNEGSYSRNMLTINIYMED